MENNHRELQLLPMAIPYTTPSYPRASSWPSNLIPFQSNDHHCPSSDDGPSLELQLSTTFRLNKPLPVEDAIKWCVTDQIQLAAMESAYVERVMQMTRREMEMAQLEFARARFMWDRAREEVERAEKMKEIATCRIGSCMEVTCQVCRSKFSA